MRGWGGEGHISITVLINDRESLHSKAIVFQEAVVTFRRCLF